MNKMGSQTSSLLIEWGLLLNKGFVCTAAPSGRRGKLLQDPRRSDVLSNEVG